MSEFDTYKDVLIPLGSAIIGGGLVSFINYFFDVRKRREEIKEEFKRKAYGDFLDKARSFLNDPNLSKTEIIDRQKEFIAKYYNEIMVSAPKEIIKAVEDFFNTVSIAHTDKDEKTEALDKLLKNIRKDLRLDDVSDLERLFMGYTPNIEQISKEKPDDKK